MWQRVRSIADEILELKGLRLHYKVKKKSGYFMISFPKYFSEWTYFFPFLDIDECAEGLHSCDVHAYCNNTAGSYTCTCKPTYHGDGENCILRKYH